MRLRDSVNTVCQPTAILASRDFLFSHFLFPFYNFFFFLISFCFSQWHGQKLWIYYRWSLKLLLQKNLIIYVKQWNLLFYLLDVHSTVLLILKSVGKKTFFLCSATRWHQQPTCFGDCNKSALLLRTRSMKTQYGHTHTHTHTSHPLWWMTFADRGSEQPPAGCN